jgi:hypothetical protein
MRGLTTGFQSRHVAEKIPAYRHMLCGRAHKLSERDCGSGVWRISSGAKWNKPIAAATCSRSGAGSWMLGLNFAANRNGQGSCHPAALSVSGMLPTTALPLSGIWLFLRSRATAASAAASLAVLTDEATHIFTLCAEHPTILRWLPPYLDRHLPARVIILLCNT